MQEINHAGEHKAGAGSCVVQVPPKDMLITPVQCKSLWRQFKTETEYTVTQAISAQVVHPYITFISLITNFRLLVIGNYTVKSEFCYSLIQVIAHKNGRFMKCNVLISSEDIAGCQPPLFLLRFILVKYKRKSGSNCKLFKDVAKNYPSCMLHNLQFFADRSVMPFLKKWDFLFIP